MTEDTIGMLEPTGVVPFTISIDEARSIMHKWIGRSNFACKEKALMDKADKIFGVYVPYWVFDTDTYAFYQGKFGETRGSGDDAYTSWHKATGASTLNIRGLTVIASKRLEKDRYWSQISHFNMNMMKQYDPNLLSGFASERYTVDGMEAWGKAELNIVDMLPKSLNRPKS